MDYHYLPTALLATLVASQPRNGVARTIRSIEEEPKTWTVVSKRDWSKSSTLDRIPLDQAVDEVRDFFITSNTLARLRLERTISHVQVRVDVLCHRWANNCASVGFSHDFAAHMIVDGKSFGLLQEEVTWLLLALLAQTPQLLATDQSRQMDRLLLAAFQSEDLDK